MVLNFSICSLSSATALSRSSSRSHLTQLELLPPSSGSSRLRHSPQPETSAATFLGRPAVRVAAVFRGRARHLVETVINLRSRRLWVGKPVSRTRKDRASASRRMNACCCSTLRALRTHWLPGYVPDGQSRTAARPQAFSNAKGVGTVPLSWQRPRHVSRSRESCRAAPLSQGSPGKGT